jgi:hypothetical protein
MSLFYALILLLFADSGTPRPRLIEWGWDQASAAQLGSQAPEMEKAPFDGVILNAIG